MEDLELFNEAVVATNLPIRVSHVKDGSKLVQHLLAGLKPNLILLDVHLPFFNAIDFVKDLKSKEGFKEIPIVIYSSYPIHRFFQSCIEAGASSYLVKPNCFVQWTQVVRDLYSNDYGMNASRWAGFNGRSISSF